MIVVAKVCPYSNECSSPVGPSSPEGPVLYVLIPI